MCDSLSKREVSISDADDLLSWRNDPSMLMFQRNKIPINRRSHIKWLSDRIELIPALPFMVYELVSLEKVGAVRLDSREDNSLELSIIVNPKFRGKGYGKLILVDFLAEVSSMGYFDEIIACIHIFNQHSLHLFQEVGFKGGEKRRGDFLEFRYNLKHKTHHST